MSIVVYPFKILIQEGNLGLITAAENSEPKGFDSAALRHGGSGEPSAVDSAKMKNHPHTRPMVQSINELKRQAPTGQELGRKPNKSELQGQ